MGFGRRSSRFAGAWEVAAPGTPLPVSNRGVGEVDALAVRERREPCEHVAELVFEIGSISHPQRPREFADLLGEPPEGPVPAPRDVALEVGIAKRRLQVVQIHEGWSVAARLEPPLLAAGVVTHQW